MAPIKRVSLGSSILAKTTSVLISKVHAPTEFHTNLSTSLGCFNNYLSCLILHKRSEVLSTLLLGNFFLKIRYISFPLDAQCLVNFNFHHYMTLFRCEIILLVQYFKTFALLDNQERKKWKEGKDFGNNRELNILIILTKSWESLTYYFKI